MAYVSEIEWGAYKEPRRAVGMEEGSKIRVWEGMKENSWERKYWPLWRCLGLERKQGAILQSEEKIPKKNAEREDSAVLAVDGRLYHFV